MSSSSPNPAPRAFSSSAGPQRSSSSSSPIADDVLREIERLSAQRFASSSSPSPTARAQQPQQKTTPGSNHSSPFARVNLSGGRPATAASSSSASSAGAAAARNGGASASSSSRPRNAFDDLIYPNHSTGGYQNERPMFEEYDDREVSEQRVRESSNNSSTNDNSNSNSNQKKNGGHHLHGAYVNVDSVETSSTDSAPPPPPPPHPPSVSDADDENNENQDDVPPPPPPPAPRKHDDEESNDYEEEELEEDYSILKDAATVNRASPEKHPESGKVELHFHQLRLSQRVAGELGGVLREHAKPSAALAAALERQKEARRQRDEFIKKESLQQAREQETSYQRDEVGTQGVRRLDGVTDVLQRTLDCEQAHFGPLRALEDRIIEKQRSAQRKKLELQRLQSIAEDCISQLTTFELHNAQRERSIAALEAEVERKQKEQAAADEAFEARQKQVAAREAKISEWVDALETKEKHLSTTDRDLQSWADDFLQREEALRLAKKENTRPSNSSAQQQHQQQQSEGGGRGFAPSGQVPQKQQPQHFHHHSATAAAPVPPPPPAAAAASLHDAPEALDMDDGDDHLGMTPSKNNNAW